MMDDVIEILYHDGKGYATINLKNFFPCSLKDFSKLLKWVEMDFQHDAEIKKNLKVYFQKQIAENEKMWKEYSAKYYDAVQKAADYGRIVEFKKLPNGVPIKKDEVKEYREKRSTEKARASGCLSGTKSYKRKKDRFQKLMAELENRVG